MYVIENIKHVNLLTSRLFNKLKFITRKEKAREIYKFACAIVFNIEQFPQEDNPEKLRLLEIIASEKLGMLEGFIESHLLDSLKDAISYAVDNIEAAMEEAIDATNQNNGVPQRDDEFV